MSAKDISAEVVATKILVVRGRKVMLDRDLAELYSVKTRDLNKAVERNRDRFPNDFMYQLTREEVTILKFQFGTSSWGGTRKPPNVFTEQGVAMLSGILHSKRAVQVNIAIMRAFVKLREVLLTHKDLAQKLEELEQKYQLHETDIQVIFEAIKKLLEPPDEPPKPRFGMN
ncbi:MAG: ORF6N domain-containing protein [Candidatus Omnitrophica bacterium]|nr:ORF6N domain-containing protein [Candidatus Omnitrophota bacterium]